MAEVTGRLPSGAGIRVTYDDGQISAVEPVDGAPELTIWPGLVDIQVNGYAGHDVNADDIDVDAVRGLVGSLHRHGVTSVCPTVITAPEDKIVRALRMIVRARAEDPVVAHAIVGIHVEGPSLAAADGPRGAHDLDALRDPDVAEFARWQVAAQGLVRIVTLAPERSGAADYIAKVAARGVVVSIGHSAGTPDDIRRAVAAGARASTHLGNGSAAMLHRHDNHLWPQLAAVELTAGFIADGHHLPADTFTAMVRAKGVDRSVLVSDAVALAGQRPGVYATPVGSSVTVEPNGRLTLTGTPYLAGSGAALDECVAWVRDATPIPVADAVTMATANPSRLLGLADRGLLEPGASADFVLLDGDRVVRTVAAGRDCF